MNTLFFDTETTGLVLDRLHPHHRKQPLPVQLGCKLDTENRVERHATNVIIEPQGWEVEPKAASIHGITTQMAYDLGINFISAIEMFYDFVSLADVVVAHNTPFDITVMRRACFVYSEMVEEEYVEPFTDEKTLLCTMRATTNICKLLPKKYGTYKWPKLTEATKFFFNEELDGAHDALVDVRACARLHYHLMDERLYVDDQHIIT